MTETAPAGRRRSRRRRWVAKLQELHEGLRTEGDTPARHAAAIALGTFIGCIPLYGAHLLLCVTLASLFRLNRALTYLAAHINNPLTAPPLLALAFGIGHRILEGGWPPMNWAEIAAVGPWRIGGDVLCGSVVLGLVLGAALGAVAYVVSLRARPDPEWARVVDETARRYMPSGILQWEFVRGKLLYDPLYRAIGSRLEARGWGRVLDLGCGRGVVLALADGVRRTRPSPGAAAPVELVGVEVRATTARVARAALGDAALIVVADLSVYPPPEADIVLLLDVLHYLDAPAQERIVGRVAAVLRPGGLLLVREPDASSGARFLVTRAAERMRAVFRGAWRQRFHYRSGADWMRLFVAHGLAVTATPMDRDTPFANLLFEARRSATPDVAPVTISATGR
jgi:uncharacterized protein (DUF2062 family)/trans-aconitate methyltransferase